MKSHWINHNGARIFIADFSNYGSDSTAIQAEADHIIQLLQTEPAASVLSITNIEGTLSNESTIRILTSLVSVTNKHVKTRCVLGIHGFRKHLLAGFTRLTGRAQFNIFETQEEAIEFLTQKG